MRRGLLLGLLLASALACADTVSHVRFGADAFNRAVSVAAKGTVVFSPLSFELDSVALSDAFDPIVKAHFAEQLGVLSDFEGVYGQIIGRLRAGAESNRFSFASARAMCLPDVRMSSVAYRRDIQRLYSAEICAATPKEGAEYWLKNMMDGDMEDFSIPMGAVTRDKYAYYDLASVRFSWQEPFPTSNSRKIPFVLDDGSRCEVDAMCDLRAADLWENRRFTLLRLPLADGAWFYAMIPAGGMSLRDMRAEFSSAKIDDLLSVMRSVSITGVSHGPVAIAIPKMDVMSTVDLVGVFSYFRFPLKGFSRMDGDIRPALVRQTVRFRLDEQGLDPEPLAEKPAEAIVHADAGTKRLVLNRPFLFFVYHEPSGTMPIAGQFTGR
jgi:hypothetical protein